MANNGDGLETRTLDLLARSRSAQPSSPRSRLAFASSPRATPGTSQAHAPGSPRAFGPWSTSPQSTHELQGGLTATSLAIPPARTSGAPNSPGPARAPVGPASPVPRSAPAAPSTAAAAVLSPRSAPHTISAQDAEDRAGLAVGRAAIVAAAAAASAAAAATRGGHTFLAISALHSPLHYSPSPRRGVPPSPSRSPRSYPAQPSPSPPAPTVQNTTPAGIASLSAAAMAMASSAASTARSSPRGGGMSKTLRDEVLLPWATGLLAPTVAESLRPRSAPATPVGSNYRKYTTLDEGVQHMLGTFSLHKVVGQCAATRHTLRMDPRPAPPWAPEAYSTTVAGLDSGVLVGQGSRPASPLVASRPGSGGHPPSPPAAAAYASGNATFPTLRPRTANSTTSDHNIGDFLVSRELSFAGTTPLKHTPAAPGVFFERHSLVRAEEAPLGPVQALYLRKHRATPDGPILNGPTPVREAVDNPRALFNGVPVSRLTALRQCHSAHGYPQHQQNAAQHHLANAAAVQQRKPRSASAGRRKRNTPHSVAERREATSAAVKALAQSEPVPVMLHRVTAEPLLDDNFYDMIESHFTGIADTTTQRLHSQLNASLPVILETFGVEPAGRDGLNKIPGGLQAV